MICSVEPCYAFCESTGPLKMFRAASLQVIFSMLLFRNKGFDYARQKLPFFELCTKFSAVGRPLSPREMPVPCAMTHQTDPPRNLGSKSIIGKLTLHLYSNLTPPIHNAPVAATS